MLIPGEASGQSQTLESGIDIQVYEDLDAMEPMRSEWDAFVERTGCEISLSYDWCRIWWKYYGTGRDLRVLVFRKEGELVGLVPLFLETIWLACIRVRAAKLVGSDHSMSTFSLPIISRHFKDVLAALARSITTWGCDIVHLGPLSGRYTCTDALAEGFQEALGPTHAVRLFESNVQTYFRVPESWDSYVAGLKKSERTEVRRNPKLAVRAIGDESCEVTRVPASERNWEALFEGFVKMHGTQWAREGKSGHFRDWPQAEAFHKELAHANLRHGRLFLYEIRISDTVLGYKYGYRFGAQLVEFLDARSCDPRLARVSLGRVVFCELMKQAIEDGVEWIDSLRNYYEHKMRLGGELHKVHELFIYPRHWAALVKVRLLGAMAKLWRLLYYRLWYSRIVPRLPLPRPTIRRTYIRLSVFSTLAGK